VCGNDQVVFYCKSPSVPLFFCRHVGDLGNIMSDKDGNVETEFFDYFMSLNGSNSVIGRSIVVRMG
jgi:Cu-Zn family superoxide dismutase